MDTRQRQGEEEGEASLEIAPKVQAWTVVKERHREDSGHGKMCGEWVIPSSGVILVVYCKTCELMLA
ncbi:hypothetical protein Bca52824_033146 [Brassica carinata]|uniref:Uncharacterized protein n=1 Tax=Brassica carinata TaxID=52824 RepID=A0A8X7SFG7_BRACI|nr:hypothetical protein Bca52824_033146 [Brassica carinata]